MSAGWGSNSKYAVLGGTRAVAQCISYEVCFSLLLLCFCLLSSLHLLRPHTFEYVSFCLPLVFILFVSVLAETNRSPFDFAEGESELVSGFNVEFAGPGFVILFLSEYLSILFISGLVGLLTLDGSCFSTIIMCSIYSFVFVWGRGTLPRYRYDQLIMLCWKSLLPLVLSYFVLFLIL